MLQLKCIGHIILWRQYRSEEEHVKKLQLLLTVPLVLRIRYIM